MRRVVGLCAIVLLASGCWASSKPSSDGEASPELSRSGEEAEPVSGVPELDLPLATVEGDHFESFDLLRNRPLAHRLTRGDDGVSVYIDVGSADVARYIQGNHSREFLSVVEEEGAKVLGTRGREGTFTMPGPVLESPGVLEMRVWNPARGDNFLQVTANGVDLERVKLEEGWQTLELTLPEGALKPENDVALSFSNLGRIDGSLSGGGLAWARLGPAGSAIVEAVEEAEEDVVGEEVDAYAEAGDGIDEDGAADEGGADGAEEQEEEQIEVASGPSHEVLDQGPLSLKEGRGLSWTLWVQDDAVLDLEVEAGHGCGVEIDLWVEAGEGEIEQVLREEVRLVEGRGAVQETSFSLGVEESQVARLNVLPAEGCDDEVVVRRARTIRPGAIAGVPEEIEPPKYVLFWIIDTLRADYLPIHFETDVQAPNLARLAEEGVTFEVAYVQGTESRASHASLFTGKYPERHGVMARGRVNPQLPILPNFFQDQGYRTALMASNGYVSHLLNLNRGWDHYQNNIHNETGLSARVMVQEGLEWIRSVEEGHPFFLYLGTIDPHVTYRMHPEVIELYEPADYRGRFRRFLSGEDLGLIKGRRMTVTEREKERIINLYKNEITFNDIWFGNLREALEEKGIWEDTLIVVTSDHGEEFWEHGSVGHGHNVHQEMVHVPLIFHYPRGLPSGRSVRSGAEVIDVLPTVLELIGAEDPGDRQGRSLLPTIFGEHGGYPAPALATQYMRHYGLQIEDWKIYLRGGSMRVYDRRTDILEMNDVRADHPLASRWLQDSVGWFRAYRREWDKATWGVSNNVSGEFVALISGE